MTRAALALLLGLVALGADAQTVFRCGSAYSQTPCPQGRIVDATDPRTAAQRAEALRVVASERRLAADMRRERLADQPAPTSAASLSGTAPTKVVAIEKVRMKKKKHASIKPPPTTDFIAKSPRTRK